MNVPQVIPRSHDDIRIFVLAGEVKEVDHQLKCGVADGLHQLEAFRRRVDDVGLFPPQGLHGDGDAAAPREGRDAASEVDELAERFPLRETVGHASGPAAAEHHEADAERATRSKALFT